MYFCLRIDVDYVPWDSPDAEEFGHGEPAVLLRLLDLARTTGYKLHFFVSNRAHRAFPAVSDAILNDGHDLDWLCKHPEQADGRFKEFREMMDSIGHSLEGFASKFPWPSADFEFIGMNDLKFACTGPGPRPGALRHFVVDSRPLRDAARSGQSLRAWGENMKSQLRDNAARNRGIVAVVRPQVLAKLDPHLGTIKEILDLGEAVGNPPMTLRDVLKLD